MQCFGKESRGMANYIELKQREIQGKEIKDQRTRLNILENLIIK